MPRKDYLAVGLVLLVGDLLEHLEPQPGEDLLRVVRGGLGDTESEVMLAGQGKGLAGELRAQTWVALRGVRRQDEQLEVSGAVVPKRKSFISYVIRHKEALYLWKMLTELARCSRKSSTFPNLAGITSHRSGASSSLPSGFSSQSLPSDGSGEP